MIFKPYDVKRFDYDREDGMSAARQGDYVESSDYDSLYDLWDELNTEISRLEKIIKGVSELCDSL